MGHLRVFGPLRIALLVLVVALIITGPFAGRGDHYTFWGLYFSGIAPAVVVILIFVLPLDITMCRVFMSDTEEHARYRKIIRWESLCLAALLLAWTPFFLWVLRV